MAARTDALEGVLDAWRALAGEHDGEGWRTIPVSTTAPCVLLAGRHLPQGEEAILLGFSSSEAIPAAALPAGHGFDVSKLPADPTGADRAWLALTRRQGGSVELFAMMAEDLVRLLESSRYMTEDMLFHRFVTRIRAWQEFMERHRDGVLSPESEVGLFGELIILSQMLDLGVTARPVLDAWQGPIDGLQDFIFGSGAIEVKTTVSAGGFPASVGTLEQLDETLRYPLFVAGVRLAVDRAGRSLPALADALRSRLAAATSDVLEILEVRLVQAGLLTTSVDRYPRRFTHVSTTLFAVNEAFPRLTRCNVSPAIRRARYEIELSMVQGGSADLISALEQLGAV